jgi:hypothetical protein
MHRGHQTAATADAAEAGGTPKIAGGMIRRPGQLRPPALLPFAAAGPPGIAVRAVGTEPESPRAAREFTRDTLQRWDMCALLQDTAMVVSELVTNALFHGVRGSGAAVGGHDATGAQSPPGLGGGQVELTLWHRTSHLVCAVTDPSADPPVLRSPDPGAEAGRGLQVVQALAASWGWAMLGFHRKLVWAALRVPRARLAARARPQGRLTGWARRAWPPGATQVGREAHPAD